ncbi:hypothetical protein R1sor_011035 [Riccia sorocarpa]|uniref:DUF2428 domain-containing protein n=1 Tax=Riccia sorocarpa TaxID=122646 RepID=A0ABD3I365_9MARC
MAGRWRSQQRRKRWTDHAAFLSVGTVSSLGLLPELEPLAKQLSVFEAQPSIYAQLAQVKPLGKVFLTLLPELKSNERALRLCVQAFLELLFVENSRPLHRGLLSILSHVPREYSDVLRDSFQACCREYGPGGARERKFAVVAVAASLAGLPQPGVMKEVAQDSVFYTGNAACHDVRGVLQHALEGGRPTPTIMEEAQNALSSIYYMLQQFPVCFKCDNSSNSHESGPVQEGGIITDSSRTRVAEELFGSVVSLLLDVLQTSSLSRDCVVAAGVGLAAAAQLHSENEGLALLLARMAFPSSFSLYAYQSLSSERGLITNKTDEGILPAVVLKGRKSTLWYEMERLSDFGKLCFFRGILTAVSRDILNALLLRAPLQITASPDRSKSETQVFSDENLSKSSIDLSSGTRWQVWTLLYNGILPALCGFCEGSVDSHFKFHAVTALQICLQQIKTSICGHLTESLFAEFVASARAHNVFLSDYAPLTSAVVTRVLQLIWNNWEDPLTQTVKQVQLVFDLLVDVQLVYKSDSYATEIVDAGESLPQEEEFRKEKFLYQIANDLLSAGRYRKGKYVPLASLVQRIGARKLLALKPDLLFQTIHALSDDDVCCAASTFYKSFLDRLREDCWISEGVTEGTIAARRLWIPAVLSGLLSGDSRLRTNLTTYALPVALQIDSDSLLVIVDYVLDGHSRCSEADGTSLSVDQLGGASGLPENLSINQQVLLLISALKVARTTALALVDGAIGYTLKPSDKHTARYESGVEDKIIAAKVLKNMSHAVFIIKGQAVEVHVNLLLMALTHKDDGLRVDATELMCLNPKTASMPSPLELCLLRIALPLNMRCSSTSFRMRWTSFIRKFFHHVRSSVERQLKAKAVGKSQQASSEETSDSAVSVPEMEDFMQWLSQMLISSLYPSAPYERKNMAMELFYALIQVWSLDEFGRKGDVLESSEFSPYHKSLLSADSTLVVVGAILDSWDKLRENANRILVCYPTPLPGLDSERSVESLLRWAKTLASSPRVRESDAGALALRLIFRKYVVELGWVVKVHPEPCVLRRTGSSENEAKSANMLVQYFDSLNDWLQWGIEEGDKDLLKACKQSFVHGVLLVLRYAVDEVDWSSACVQASFGSFRVTFERLLALLLRVTSLALWVVSADALILKSKLHESPSGNQDSDAGEVELTELNGAEAALDDEYDSDLEEGLAPAEQIVMVGCWLSVKEVSLLLGTIARAVPLPGSSTGEGREESEEGENGQKGTTDSRNANVMLDGKQLEAIGSHFLQVLLSMKHNGAIDKTRTGFIALCDRLLRSSDPWLNKMPEVWLQQLMMHTGAKGQVVDDLLRRSAGIPPAFLALFLAEPDGAPKKLLPMGMRWLLDTCKGFVADVNGQDQTTTAEAEREDGIDVSFRVKALIDSSRTTGGSSLPVALKSRDEGVVPTVHAFNVLRVAFHDTNLATDTSGFCAEGLMTAVQAFASSHWEVRNAATLAFTALVHRMIGFLNTYQRESARRAITGFEFFHRYPSLHPFLLGELKSATCQLEHGITKGRSTGDGLASSLHPSLAPVLIVLSRLKPSFINGDVEDWLNPSAFMPYVSQCATQRNLQVRVLASSALAPLVSSEDLLKVLLELARSLPVSAHSKNSPAANRDQVGITGPEKRVQVSGITKVSSYNAIHGVLLQMSALITGNCVSLPDRDLQGRIVTQIFDVVKDCSWLGSIKHCRCSIVVGAFLDMLGKLLELAEVYYQEVTNQGSICNQLHQLLTLFTQDCLSDNTFGSDLHDPTRIRLREKAAKLYFQALFMQRPTEGSPGDDEVVQTLASTLERTLSDASYEVRLATLKVLKENCSKVYGTFSCLRTVIIDRLMQEKHPLCTRRILQLIYKWWLMDKSDSHSNFYDTATGENSHWDSGISAESLWSALLKIYSTSKQIKTKEESVRCLGGALQHVRSSVKHLTRPQGRDAELPSSSDRERWEHVKDVLSTWLVITKRHSVASEPVNFRRAIAEAIVASGLLEDTDWLGKALDENRGDQGRSISVEYGEAILCMWRITIKLLEDEDLELRHNLSLAVLGVIASSGSVPDVVPAQVEKVIQVSFDFLTSRLGTWTKYYSVLSEWLIGSNIDFTLSKSNGDLVRRLFDKEIDNHHEEELLFVQLCSSHIETFISLRLKQEKVDLGNGYVSLSELSNGELSLHSWRLRHLTQARFCAERSVESSNNVQWVGGVTNHQDTFKNLYRSLLGLLTFSGYREDEGFLCRITSDEVSDLLPGLTVLTASLKQLSLNPLISNIFLLVLIAYEHQLGLSLGSEDFREHTGNAFVTKFEPLFLIR